MTRAPGASGARCSCGRQDDARPLPKGHDGCHRRGDGYGGVFEGTFPTIARSRVADRVFVSVPVESETFTTSDLLRATVLRR